MFALLGFCFDLLVAHGDDGVGELVDAVVNGLRNADVALGEDEGVVSVVGGVEEVLMVELTEDEGHQDVVGGHGVLRIGALDGLEAGEGAVVVEVVEEGVGFADLGCEVDGVGVRIGRVGEKRCGQDEEENEGREEQEIRIAESVLGRRGLCALGVFDGPSCCCNVRRSSGVEETPERDEGWLRYLVLGI